MNERPSIYLQGITQEKTETRTMEVSHMPASLPFLVFRMLQRFRLSLWSLPSLARISGAFLICACLCGKAYSTEGIPQLNTEIGVLQSTANTTVAAFNRIEADTNLNLGGLVTGGIVTATAGSTISWPLYYIASTFSVTGVQVDVVIPSSFTVVSVSTGPVSANAGKSVSASVVNGNERVIVFGLNQTPLGSGEVAVISLRVTPSTPSRLYPFALINPVASDANGNTVLISAESGTVEVQ